MIKVTLDEQLLVDLKMRLHITWEDAETNRVLTISIKSGKRYLNELCETQFTFDEESTERELLMERCRYDWNNALDEFEMNYKRNLLKLIYDAAGKQYEESMRDE